MIIIPLYLVLLAGCRELVVWLCVALRGGGKKRVKLRTADFSLELFFFFVS